MTSASVLRNICLSAIACCSMTSQATETAASALPAPFQQGNLLWEEKLAMHQYTIPSLNNGQLFLGINDHYLEHPAQQPTGGGLLQCRNPKSGKLDWQLVIPRYEEGDIAPSHFNRWKCGVCSRPAFDDERLYDAAGYPADLYAKPGTKVANRAGLAKWGAWVNSFGAREYGRPVFLASSADLAGSTNIAGFGDGRDGFDGYGWYERTGTDQGALLPQEITEFTNSGIMAGMATVNLSVDPEKSFDGFWGASSTYGSFSYLLFGMLRLIQMGLGQPHSLFRVRERRRVFSQAIVD